MGLSSQLAVSAIARPGVCTSSTRPASPYQGQVIYQTDTNTTLVWNGSGWVLLSTGTANPVGLELIATSTATSGTTMDIQSCFNAQYDNYKIVVSDVRLSTAGTITCQLLSGSTPLTSNYAWAYIRVDYPTTPAVAPYGSGYPAYASSWAVFGTYGYNGTTSAPASLEIFHPYLAQYKYMSCDAFDSRGSSGYAIIRGQGTNIATGQYDGIRFSFTQTILNAKIRVYGYRN